MRKKLLIWDFDGVIANTEDVWLKNRQQLLKSKLGIDWNWHTINQHLRGMSDKTKQQKLSDLGVQTNEAFWKDVTSMDIDVIQHQKFVLAPDIEKIFELPIKQCIATGGVFDKTMLKIQNVGIQKYFTPKQVFTADMVLHGKPAPDLFLLACQKMGEFPENTVVIEDSIAGLKAALAAHCTPIAFLGFYTNEQEEYLSYLHELKIQYMCKSMSEVYAIIQDLF